MIGLRKALPASANSMAHERWGGREGSQATYSTVQCAADVLTTCRPCPARHSAERACVHASQGVMLPIVFCFCIRPLLHTYAVFR